jgi:DNA transposition AAA+ family ATPase
MRDRIVLTPNIRNFVSVADSLKAKPKRSDVMGLVYGRYGLGKTTAMEWYYSNNPCTYVCALQVWATSVNMMVEDILRAFRVEPRGRMKTDFPELVRTLKKYNHPLFIDEADRVVRRTALIETVRDIHDQSKIPIILIGQEGIMSMLRRGDLGPVLSRITALCEFRELTAKDIQQICSELCELECDSNVAGYIRKVTLGDFRLMNTFLTRAEELCDLNRLTKITPAIAKAASSAMPHPDDIKRASDNERLLSGEPEPVKMVAGAR